MKKSTIEQFTEWLISEGVRESEPQQIEPGGADPGSYPAIQDGGNPFVNKGMPDGRTKEQQFSEWLNDCLNDNPFTWK